MFVTCFSLFEVVTFLCPLKPSKFSEYLCKRCILTSEGAGQVPLFTLGGCRPCLSLAEDP